MPQNPQNPSNIFDLESPQPLSSPAPAPGVSTQGGEDRNIFDMFGDSPSSQAPAPKSVETPQQKSESNTLWGNAKAETVLGELGAGLQQGARTVAATAPSLLGLGAHYFDEGLGQAFMEWGRQIEEGGAKRGVGRIEDLTLDPMSWARYTAGTIGEAVPFVLSIMSGAGAGKLLADVLRKKGVDAATKTAILSTAPAFGGAFATAGAIETGATAREMFEATGKNWPITSLTAGSAKGALESLFPMVLSRQLGLTIGQGSDLYGRILGNLAGTASTRLGMAARGVATEGLTELAQEEVDITARTFADENYSRLSPEAWSRRANALVAGGVGGGVLSQLASPERPQTILADKEIRDAAGETPMVFGAEVDELPVMGPEHILRTGGTGLDATAGIASGKMLDDALSTVDLRSRGLYAAAVKGRDPVFGTQEQADNDHAFYQGDGYLRLDPSKVSRGDVSAAVEDLPSTIADPRVDFTNPATMAEASSKLAQALKAHKAATSATSDLRMSALLDSAQALYREALDLGARVEPLSDGQVVLRDPKKVAQLAGAQATVDPQVSRASLLETRVRPDNSGEFYVMAAGEERARSKPGGRPIDLENISPNSITGFPSAEITRQILSDHAVARGLDISRAAAKGVRFLPTTENPKELLAEFIKLIQTTSQGVRFYRQGASKVERFMQLVDEGLRIDVTPDSEDFAVLEKVGPKTLRPRSDEGSTMFSFLGQKAATADLVKLDEAVRMENSGSTREEIWQQTGWFRGVDEMWRFEVDDRDMEVDQSHAFEPKTAKELFGKNENTRPFNEAVSFPALEAAYPNEPLTGPLALTKRSNGKTGFYNFADEAITAEYTTPDDLRAVLLHEIQHAIQAREGFDGASYAFQRPEVLAQAKKRTEEVFGPLNAALLDLRGKINAAENYAERAPLYVELEKLHEEIKTLEQSGGVRANASETAYRMGSNEVDANAVMHRRSMTPQERAETPPWLSQEFSGNYVFRSAKNPTYKSKTPTQTEAPMQEIASAKSNTLARKPQLLGEIKPKPHFNWPSKNAKRLPPNPKLKGHTLLSRLPFEARKQIVADVEEAAKAVLPSDWKARVAPVLRFSNLSEKTQTENPNVPASLKLEGAFDPHEKLIYITLAALDPLERVYEEAGHALRHLRAIPDADYNILLKEADRINARRIFDIEARYFKLYSKRFRDANALEDKLDEEAVMQMLAARANGKSFTPTADTLLDRILAALRTVWSALTGNRSRNFDDVVNDFKTGEWAKNAGKSQGSDAMFSLPNSKRTREARVTKKINFASDEVAALFYSQFHSSYLQKLLTGELKKGSDLPITPYSQVAGRSAVTNFIRDLARKLGVTTDFYVEVVGPGTLGGDGVRYVETSRVLKEGKPAKDRTVIQIDPWAYARPTEGGKPLVENPATRANVFVSQPLGEAEYGLAQLIAPANASELKKVKMAPEEFGRKHPGATHFRAVEKEPGKGWSLAEVGAYDKLQGKLQAQIEAGSLRQISDLYAKDSMVWRKAKAGEAVEPPAPFNPKPSLAGRLAANLGAPSTKLYTPPELVTQFYADFTRALGQIIVKFEYGKLSAGEQDLMRQAYTREKNAARSLDKSAAMARVFAHPILQRAIGERGPDAELYNFEEWVVQNISRALLDTDSPLGPVRTFFDKAGKKIAAMLKDVAAWVGLPFSADKRKGKAAEEVQQWLERLTKRGMEDLTPPFLTNATKEAALASIRENQAALDGWNLEYVAATPQRASTAQVRKLLEHIPPEAKEDRAKLNALLASADRHNTMLEWLLGIHQLADLNPHIEPLRRYVSLNRAMEDDAISWSTMADERLRQVQKLPKPQQKGLWGLMFDLDQMTYLDKEKLKKGEEMARWPTGEELITLVRKHGLSAEAFGAYKSIRQDFLSFLTQLEITGIRNATETLSDPALLEDKVTEISGQIAQMKSRPYFPHMRFGKYVVKVKDKKGVVKFFAAFETKAQREAAIKGIQKDWSVPQINSIVEDEMSPTMQQFQGLPKFVLDEVRKTLGLDAENLTPSQRRDRDNLEALAFSALPINSFRQNLQNRNNTPGYSMDGMRAYATYFARGSRFVARMEYATRLQNSIKDIRKSGSQISKDARTRIADQMQRHYEAEMNPAGDWAEARALGFLWYFAFAPAAAFVNLSQVPLVTYPYLASKFPATKRGIAAGVTQTLNENVKQLFGGLKGKGKVVPGPKQEALDEAHLSRLIDDGFAQELAAVSQGSTLSRTLAESKVGRSVRLLGQWGTYPFQLTERFNRSVTFRVGYDLALRNPDNPYVKEAVEKNKIEADRLRIDRGWGEQQIAAYIFAAEAVRSSQFEYSRWARPKIMQGKGSVFFMFKSYMQNMIHFMFNANRGTQARFLLLLFATAGLMGLPGAEDAEDLAKKLGKALGFDINPQLWLRGMLKNWVGDSQIPDILLHGASRVGFGVPHVLNKLGVPSATPDLSRSLGMGRIIPGLQAIMKPSDTGSFNEMVGDVTQEMAGSLLAVPFSLYQSIVDHSLPADDPKRWERAMPRALRDVTRASRYLAEQRERDRTGASVVNFDPNDLSDQMDALAVGAGFTPAQISRRYEVIEATKEAQIYWRSQRKMLLDAYGRADRLKDVEGKQDAKAGIREFNNSVPDSKMRITHDTLQRSLRGREKERRAKETGVPSQKGLRGVTREIQGLFPEAPPPLPRSQVSPARPAAGSTQPFVVEEKRIR